MPFTEQVLQDFIGKGMTYPINLVDGKPKIETGFNLIKSSIKICAAWPHGVRFFLAEFGSRIHEILEEPNDDALKSLLSTFFRDAVYAWEKRVEEIEVSFEDITLTELKVIVNYRVINSPQVESFIIPFYRNITA